MVFQQTTFKLGTFTNFKVLFSVVLTGFPKLVHDKSWKKREKVYSSNITYVTWIVFKGHKAILFFFSLFSVVRPTQIFGIFKIKKKGTT